MDISAHNFHTLSKVFFWPNNSNQLTLSFTGDNNQRLDLSIWGLVDAKRVFLALALVAKDSEHNSNPVELGAFQ